MQGPNTFHMKRTRRKRIALALQFDDYSDNLLESSLYDYDYVYQSMSMDYAYVMTMTMSMMPMRLRLCHSLCYGHMAMPMAMPSYGNYGGYAYGGYAYGYA